MTAGHHVEIMLRFVDAYSAAARARRHEHIGRGRTIELQLAVADKGRLDVTGGGVGWGGSCMCAVSSRVRKQVHALLPCLRAV